MNAFSLRKSAVKAALGYWSYFRTPEIIALQGSPLLGFALAIHRPTMKMAIPLALLVAANVCLVAHIFLTNDWSELDTDITDRNKVEAFLTAALGSRHEIAAVVIILLAASLALFSLLGVTPLLLAVAIAVASALYSLPQFHLKGTPILSSVLHLIGGALHFLLGYSVASAIDSRAIAVSVFFALTFAAGHLTQEVRDYEGDERNGIRTNAATFGQRRTFIASLLLFTFAHALLCYLALRGLLPRSVAIVIALYPLHLYWSLKTLSDGLNYASVCRLQARYRTIYAIIGLVILVSLWGAHHAS
jgi:4-hydroxybenzoate polyprenyltransferase